VQEVPLKRGKVGYLCGLLVYYTLVESRLKIMNSVTPLVMVLNVFSGDFFSLRYTLLLLGKMPW
jgi:hypothetical protein